MNKKVVFFFRVFLVFVVFGLFNFVVWFMDLKILLNDFFMSIGIINFDIKVGMYMSVKLNFVKIIN